MASREPMWFCYECNAEMRPLMAPDPHCASCNGTFVEKIENPQDDPREFAQAGDEELPEMDSFAPMLLGLSNIMGGGRPTSPLRHPSNLGPEVRTGTSRSSPFGSGFSFEMSSSSNGNTRSWSFGGPNTLGSGRNRQERPGPANMSSFMRRSDSSDVPPTPGEISGPLMAQYLMALLGGSGRRRGGVGGEDPFAGLFGPSAFGPENGRWGDYAFSQEALDQIISEIMENSNTHRPVAATDEITDKLPREVLEEGSPLLEKDCAVCKEQFSLHTEDPEEQVVVTLPCKHPFHQSCILPWLKSSGTCPVCRYQLVPQPEHHDPAQPGTSRPSSSQPSGDRGSSRAGDGAGASSSSGPPGVFESIMSYIRSSNTQPHDGHGPAGGRPSQGGGSGGGSGTTGGSHSLPGGWSDQVD